MSNFTHTVNFVREGTTVGAKKTAPAAKISAQKTISNEPVFLMRRRRKWGLSAYKFILAAFQQHLQKYHPQFTLYLRSEFTLRQALSSP